VSAHKVLDSYALIAFFENQIGADKVSDLIKQARDSQTFLLLSLVNWGEVYYILYRAAGKQQAELALQSIDTLPIEIIPADREMTALAARLKVTHKMSYADCFAVALAETKRAELITGDKEFKAVEKHIRIIWL
jgi:ribonuclease VapC